MKTIIICLFFLLICLSSANAFESFVKGCLIVKYSDRVGMSVHRLVQEHGSFRSVIAVGGSSLDALHSKYHVLSAEPIFRQFTINNDSSALELRRHELIQMDQIRNKYP